MIMCAKNYKVSLNFSKLFRKKCRFFSRHNVGCNASFVATAELSNCKNKQYSILVALCKAKVAVFESELFTKEVTMVALQRLHEMKYSETRQSAIEPTKH